MDVGALGVKGANGKIIEGLREVWSPKKEDWAEGKAGNVGARYSYLSVNASSLDAGQGLDLREWHEKGWVCYLDVFDCKDENRMGKPFLHGMY